MAGRLSVLGLVIVALLLNGCGGSTSGSSSSSSSSGSKGGYGYGDGPPPKDIDVTHLPNAVPKVEPITRAGNKNPYTVMGKTYQLLPTSKGYRERGIASWYGNKFHGRNTSNGEIYDMYGMTAAHKTLPIPCYVRVTNLENGRSVIVRVNDRGPFHGTRIIDLSYAAAKKLDYSGKGTANVEVVAIDPLQYQANAVESPRIEREKIVSTPVVVPRIAAPANAVPGDAVTIKPTASVAKSSTVIADGAVNKTQPELPRTDLQKMYLQVGAFNSQLAAANLSGRLEGVSEYPVVVRQPQTTGTLYKVLVGPVQDKLKLLDLKNLLKQGENLRPFVVYE